jgi:N6-L-threonylcarbamoyladenine synthase
MPKLSDQDKEHIAEAFEDAAGEIVIIKTRRALEKTNPNILAVGGGVSANLEIREGLQELIQNEFPNVSLALPDKRLTGDNAIMIGIAAYLRHQSGAGEAGLTANGSQSLA